MDTGIFATMVVVVHTSSIIRSISAMAEPPENQMATELHMSEADFPRKVKRSSRAKR